MTFSPMNFPPGSGYPTNDNRKWYRRWWLWALVIAVGLGALFFSR